MAAERPKRRRPGKDGGPMKEALPVTMVSQLEELGQALVGVAREHRDGSLADLEQAVLGVVRRAMPGLLEEVIGLGVTNLRPAMAEMKQSCPQCGGRVRVQDWRSRTVLTVCGCVTFERPWYACEHCHQGFSPTDQTLKLQPRARLSAGLMDWLIESGARMDFRDAAEEIDRLTGLRVAPETVRRHTERRGEMLEAKDEQARAVVVKTQEAAEPLEPTPGLMVVEADGVMARFQDGWHEVKLGVVGGQVNGELEAMSYVAGRETAEVFGGRVLAEAARRGALEVIEWEGPVTGRGLARLRPVVVIGDGAAWIWNLAADHFGERTEVIDFYHASQHVWEVGKALYGEGTQVCADWANALVGALRREGAQAVLAVLSVAKAETEEAAEVLRRERGYFRGNAARMAYPDFAARGLPLGSGAVESSARHVVQSRMKRSGARWSDYGGQTVLAVRCRLASARPIAA